MIHIRLNASPVQDLSITEVSSRLLEVCDEVRRKTSLCHSWYSFLRTTTSSFGKNDLQSPKYQHPVQIFPSEVCRAAILEDILFQTKSREGKYGYDVNFRFWADNEILRSDTEKLFLQVGINEVARATSLSYVLLGINIRTLVDKIGPTIKDVQPLFLDLIGMLSTLFPVMSGSISDTSIVTILDEEYELRKEFYGAPELGWCRIINPEFLGANVCDNRSVQRFSFGSYEIYMPADSDTALIGNQAITEISKFSQAVVFSKVSETRGQEGTRENS